MERMISSLAEDFFRGGLSEGGAWLPAVDIKETEKEYLLSLELPGIEKEALKVSVKGSTLLIEGERKEDLEEKGKHYLRREQFHGAFRRAFALPEGVRPEQVKASYKDGLLSVRMPRVPQPKPQNVRIEGS